MSLRSLGPQPSASTRFRHSDPELLKYIGLVSVPSAAETAAEGTETGAGPQPRGSGCAQAEAGHLEAAQGIGVEAPHTAGGGVVVPEEADRARRHVAQHLLLHFPVQAEPLG